MQILNIVLLVLSVGLSIAGLALIDKPKPMYTLVYPEKTVKKVSFMSFFFMFVLGTCLYFFTSSFEIDQAYSILIYLIFLVISLAIFINWHYSVISQETKKKNMWKSYLSGFIGLFIGIFIPIFPILNILLFPILTVYILYWMVKYHKLGYKTYTYNFIFTWLFSIFLLLTFYIINSINNSGIIRFFKERFGSLEIIANTDVLYIILSGLIFLMLISIFMFMLDVKKHSPIYEKQYIEENKPKEIGNAEINSTNAI